MTEKITSVNLEMSARAIISYRIMAKYRHLPYEEYTEAVSIGMSLFRDVPESLLKVMIREGFLSNKAKDD